FGLSDAGCVRRDNQDRLLMDHALNLFLVADGMGGHRHGEMAAELAISTIQFYVESSQDRLDVSWPFGYSFDLSLEANRLTTAIRLANRHVWHQSEAEPRYAGMGTTVAGVLIGENEAVTCNVGDSRVYLYRGGELTQLSTDDTWITAVVARGEAAQFDLANHPMRNVLTQAAGSQENIDIHVVERPLESGDTYALTSDGLHGVIGDEAIRSILGSESTLERCVERLIDAARVRGAPDNVSVLLLRYNRE
ncbi:MAG: PP2C family protein-serine/threonine phosphatase, partial [Bryobacteraceae bacterium]